MNALKKSILLAALLICILILLRINDFQTETVSVPRPIDTIKGPDSRPSEWIWLQRTFPYDRADADVYSQAIRTTRSLRKENRTADVAWEFAGPENIGGRVVDIEFNPLNPDIVYAAAATGGVFRSDDAGHSWIPVFDDQIVLSIGDIAIDPVDPDIVYVGTGEPNGGHNNFPGGGIYQSEDGGIHWTYMGLEETRSIGRVLVNPENPEQVFVAAIGSYFGPDPHRGVYVSNDGGFTWDQSLFVSDSTGAIDLIMDPGNPSFLMAAMWERVRRPVANTGTHLDGPSSGIYRSTDGGKQWELLGPEQGLPDPFQEKIGRIGLALYPQNADSIYALYTDGSNISGLYLSPDRGDSWTLLDSQEQLIPGTGGFSWYFGQIRVRPDNPDVVYVLDVAFMRSVDGGKTFPLRDGYGNDKGLHVDHHALAFHPEDPSYVINGNDGGINISEDGGITWIKVPALPVTQFYEIGLDPQNPQRLYGGTQDNGTLRTMDGGLNSWENILGGDGFYVIVDPEDPDIIYAEWQFGNLYKIDHGTYTSLPTDSMLNDRRNWSTPVVMDPANNEVLYYGASRLYRTEDAGENWQAISGNLTRELPDSRVGTITSIAVAPGNSEVIYVGTDDGLIWVSEDYGVSWTNITRDPLPFRWITRVVVDPEDEGTVYVTFSGLKWKEAQPHVFRSTDRGHTWTDISSNLPDAPVNAFAVDTKDTRILYCGTDVGVFASFNTGQSWSPLGSGLPVVVINDMKIQESTYDLIVGTHGRSMYRLDLSSLTGLDESLSGTHSPVSFKLHQNYPNPFNRSTKISFHLSKPGTVQILIYDVRGREVYRFTDNIDNSGEHSIIWEGRANNGMDVASGVYYYQAVWNGRTVSEAPGKMVLLK